MVSLRSALRWLKRVILEMLGVDLQIEEENEEKSTERNSAN